MKNAHRPQSATSLPRAPREEASARFVKYMAMMGVRIACFLLMVLVTPYSWYTWVFAAGAIFLPYIAVVVANVGQDALSPRAQSPERTLPAAEPAAPVATDDGPPAVIRIQESRPDAPGEPR